ncbi:SusC/RagA family TonB-linked outer membrane protein [Roseimarinus sediminis]|uniref:SusC/RagA family TonB-linked outer membrane protein n=1 Tax=Roseimarinus sediminis TaxID=1610899 RepID=UPI003D1BBF46
MRFNRFKLRNVLLLAAMLLVQLSMAQQNVITGVVTDSQSGEPLPGVTIVIDGTTIGTTSGFDGDYSIEAAPGQTISYSYIGYVSQRILVQNQNTINVSLSSNIEDIGEVVIIGYGQVKKEDATGSVSAVSVDDFNKGAITSPQELVSGKIAGVQITSGGGAPGSGSTIRIRGGSSLSASNDPLIVIDGVPLDNDNVSGMRNPLNTINPNDIETFTVLKDASATAIYGSRASNGVVIITTKKGRLGQGMKVSYSGNFSVGTRASEIDVLDATEYKALLQELPTADLANAIVGEANTDWQSEIFQMATGTDHNLSLAGGVADIPYRASIGYSNQKGLLKTSSLERFTGSLNLNPLLLDEHLQVNANLKGMYVNNRFADQGAIGSAIGFDPTQPVYDSESPYGGYFTWTQPNGAPNTVAPDNPLAMLEMREDVSQVMRSIGNLSLDYKFHFLPDLRANLNLGYDYSKSEGTIDVPENASWMYDAVNGGGEKREYTQDKRNELLDFYLNYVKEIESIDSRIDVMGGYSWQHFFRENYAKSTNVAGTKDLYLANYDPTEYYLVSFFGRVNYTLKDRYLATVTLRQDGTSRFSPETRWGLFPAVALAWKMSEESFLKDVDAISDLKLRLGWGITGQQNIGQGDYPYLARYTTSQDNAAYQFGDGYVNTLRPDGYDANIKWEETTTYNIGLDYGLANNRITGTIDVYQRDTKDLLNVVPVAAGSNFTNELLTNVGDMTNKGFEFSVNGRAISTTDMFWEIGFNLTYNQNEITRLTASDDPNYLGVETGGIGGGVGNNIQIHSVNFPKNSFYVQEQVYNADGKPIEGLYVDRNKDGQITNDDRYRYKTPDADIFMGFSSRFEYKNFDASLGGRINLGNYVYNNIDSRMAYKGNLYWSSGYLNNVTRDIYNTGFYDSRFFSDYYVQDASYLRLDHITLGYSIPKLMESMNLRVYGTVQNVLVVTNYTGLDPEVSGGIDNNIYPRPRTFMLGVTLDF